jgi:hypothetical protein
MTPDELITRREAILRVSALLGGTALVGGTALFTGCREGSDLGRGEKFSAEDIAFLDEVADTILPETKTPGAKAAAVGAFMAMMVTDTYDADDQKRFREGMRTNEDSRKEADAPFISASPQARLALLQRYDREQKAIADRREERLRPTADKYLPDNRQENVPSEAGGATAVTADEPTHFFRMMKELALLGYFTSEIGYTKVLRYVESPGRFDPCVPYEAGAPSWAPHA